MKVLEVPLKDEKIFLMRSGLMYNYPLITDSEHKLGILEIHSFFAQFNVMSKHALLFMQVLEKW